MFEDALVESSDRIKTRSKYWSLVAFLINGGALITLLIWPLLHPQALPTQIMASLLVAPPPQVPPPPPASPAVRMPVRSRSLENEINAPSTLSHKTTMVTNSAELNTAVVALTNGQEISNGGQGDPLGALFETGKGRVAVQAAPRTGPPKVSSGVMDGNLLEKTAPAYPVIARQAHIQGTVVLQATIGKTGEIENLRVVSGPPLLRQAALDAVSSWRYKPFQLNGSPVAVETTVDVVFSLGN